MARIKKRKLGWAASTSPQVVGYKLYWEEDGEVTYNSPCMVLGNVTEVVLPDDVEGFNPQGGQVEFGVAAMDELGNESDLITFKANYQFKVPQAPEELWLKAMEEFHAPEIETAAAEAGEPEEKSSNVLLFENDEPQQETAAEEQQPAAESEEEKPESPKVIQHYGPGDGV